MVGISVEPLVVIEGLTPAAQVRIYHPNPILYIKYHPNPISYIKYHPNPILQGLYICRLRRPTCPLLWSSVRKRLKACSITAQGEVATLNISLNGPNLLLLKMSKV